MRNRSGRRSRPGRTLPFLVALPLCFGAPLLHGQTPRPAHFDRLVPRALGGQTFPLVHCLIQDRQGFIWIAGPGGLARYDGDTFHFFRHRDDDPGSLADEHLFNVFEDSRGRLWVTSDKGLALLDKAKGTFRQYRHDPANPRSLSSDRVRAVCEGRDGGLWVGTMDGGLNRMDPDTGEFARFLPDPEDPQSPGSDAIWALCCARDGGIWVGATGSGIDRYDPGSGVWTHYPYDAGNARGPSDWHYWALREGRDGRIWIGTNQGGLNWLEPSTGNIHRLHLREQVTRRWDYRILSLCEDRDGILWIGTDQVGLFRFDPASGELVGYPENPDKEGGLSHHTVMSIVEDLEGLLWFGTDNGLVLLNKKRFRFPVVLPKPDGAEGLASGEVLSLLEDRDGILWIGTAAGGLNRWDRKTGSWSKLGLDSEFLDFMTKVRVEAIAEDDKGDLWFGTSSGLVRLPGRKGTFIRYRNTAADPALLPSSNITALVPGRPGFLWAGTKDGGFFEWDIARGRARRFPEVGGDGLSNQQINALLVDSSGRVWIGSQWRGIVVFDPESLAWTAYSRRPDETGFLPSPTVHALAEDARGRIWAGTQAGPCFFEDGGDAWIRPAPELGVPESPVKAIVPDGEGAVWLASEENLIKVRLESGLVRTYGPEDGLQGGRFNRGAGLRRRDGDIVFGGFAGLNHFNPSAIVDNPYLPPVALTSVGLSSPPGQVLLLGTPDTLDIGRDRFPITLNLAALSFSHPERTRFRVRAPGSEGRVFELGNNRGFLLDDLEPGAHRFVFYAANNDGVWNPEGLSLTLRVTVPFWQTWTGRAGLTALAGLLGWLALRGRRRRQKRRLLHEIAEDLGSFAEKHDLTKREQDVLGLILQGKSNRDIEKELFISMKTVKNHIYNLYQKLGVKSRLELVNAVRDFAAKSYPPEAR